MLVEHAWGGYDCHGIDWVWWITPEDRAIDVWKQTRDQRFERVLWGRRHGYDGGGLVVALVEAYVMRAYDLSFTHRISRRMGERDGRNCLHGSPGGNQGFGFGNPLLRVQD